MNPIAPQPLTQSPQGVASVAPIGAPTPTAIPQAPAPSAAPAPVNAPQYDTAGTMNAIADYYKIPRDTANIVKSGQVAANQAQNQSDQANFATKLKQQQLQDSLDPNKYTVTKDTTTGGVKIINSAGDVVPLSAYVNLTGADPAKILAQSTNPKDVQFVQAYNNLQDYVQNRVAAQNGDTTAQAKVAEYNQTNPGLQKLELGQVTSAFMGKYGDYFGAPQGSQSDITPGISPTFSPSNQGSTANLSALLSALGTTTGQ